MAANLTPQYLDAEERYRAARTPEEKLAALEEMWRELPKHKSSEKLQAELKKKLSAARKACQQGNHKSAGKVDPYAIPKTGAGQIVLIGPPNCGKSSIVGALTNAHVNITEYPFATAGPVPGMARFEDVQIQLIDTPPITADHVPAGFAGLWRAADALLLVADLISDALFEDLDMCLAHLEQRKIELTDGPRELPDEPGGKLKVPGLALANKADLEGARENLEMLRELYGQRLRIEPIAARDAETLNHLPELFFGLIRVIRVYAKPPGRKPDLDEPFIVRAGSDVHDLARKIFHGAEQRVRAARLWGRGVADGQNVQLDHVLHDKDIVELHV